MRADSIHDCRQRSAHQASPRLKKRRNLETLSTDGSAAPLTGRPAASSVRVRPRASCRNRGMLFSGTHQRRRDLHASKRRERGRQFPCHHHRLTQWNVHWVGVRPRRPFEGLSPRGEIYGLAQQRARPVYLRRSPSPAVRLRPSAQGVARAGGREIRTQAGLSGPNCSTEQVHRRSRHHRRYGHDSCQGIKSRSPF